MSDFAVAAIIAFFGSFTLVPIFFGFARLFGLYTTVPERQYKVYVLFGKVVGELRASKNSRSNYGGDANTSSHSQWS